MMIWLNNLRLLQLAKIRFISKLLRQTIKSL